MVVELVHATKLLLGFYFQFETSSLQIHISLLHAGENAFLLACYIHSNSPGLETW